MKKLNENINRLKKLMNINEITMVKLKSTSYSNVKFDLDGTQNDDVNVALLNDVQKAASSVNIVATITTARVGHSYLTKSNNVSRHNFGTAVDISMLNGIGSNGATNATNGNQQFRDLGNKLKDALVSMGYTWNKESGNDKAVLWQTNTGGNHFTHLHVSNRTGSSEKEPENMNVEPTDNVSQKTSSSNTDVTSTTGQTSSTAQNNSIYDIESNFIKSLGKSFGLKEEKVYSDFGNNKILSSGIIKLPNSSNSNIKSPVDGIVNNKKSSTLCTNKIVIEHIIGKEKYYLEFCGITNPLVSHGDVVTKRKKIGTTTDDVYIYLYDSTYNRLSISDYLNKEKESSDKKDKEDDEKEYKKTKMYKDPLMAALIMAPFKLNPFKDKYDKKTGQKIQKRWASPTEKEQPSKGWLSKMSPTMKEFHEKKLTEMIERIKKLLK